MDLTVGVEKVETGNRDFSVCLCFSPQTYCNIITMVVKTDMIVHSCFHPNWAVHGWLTGYKRVTCDVTSKSARNTGRLPTHRLQSGGQHCDWLIHGEYLKLINVARCLLRPGLGVLERNIRFRSKMTPAWSPKPYQASDCANVLRHHSFLYSFFSLKVKFSSTL